MSEQDLEVCTSMEQYDHRTARVSSNTSTEQFYEVCLSSLGGAEAIVSGVSSSTSIEQYEYRDVRVPSSTSSTNRTNMKLNEYPVVRVGRVSSSTSMEQHEHRTVRVSSSTSTQQFYEVCLSSLGGAEAIVSGLSSSTSIEQYKSRVVRVVRVVRIWSCMSILSYE